MMPVGVLTWNGTPAGTVTSILLYVFLLRSRFSTRALAAACRLKTDDVLFRVAQQLATVSHQNN